MQMINHKNIFVIFTVIILVILVFFYNIESKEVKIVVKEEKDTLKIPKPINTDFKEEKTLKPNSSKGIQKNEIKENFLSLTNSKYFLKNAKSEERKLFRAIFENDYETILKLHKNGIKFKNITKNPEKILEMASYYVNDFRILDILLQHKLPVVNTYGYNCLQTALKSRNFAFLEYLTIEKEYDINYKINKFSLKFLALGHDDLEEWVKQFGGEYNEFDKKNIIYGIDNFKNKNSIERYIKAGFNFTDEQLSKITLRASRVENIEMLSYIQSLSTSLNKNLTDFHDNNALLASIGKKENTTKITKWFLENGYNPNQKNMFGENALAVAVRNKNENTILFLLKNHMTPFEKLNIRGKILDKGNRTKEKPFHIKGYDNLYIAVKKEKLQKVQKYLEKNYGYSQ